jgi:hypothetical protein
MARIGIDVSQLAYQNTGVANYLGNLVSSMIQNKENSYVLFFSSLRSALPPRIEEFAKYDNVSVVMKKIPPSGLHFLWNILHVMPIENFLGPLDLFISSDWSEPPAKKAKKATILYDLIVYKYPEETAKKIVSVQRKKLSWVKKESDIVFCISNSTKIDAQSILNIDLKKLRVVYPGY